MSYSATDLANIEAAILSLALGKRVVAIEVAGKTHSFQAVDLEKLRALRADIAVDLASAAAAAGVPVLRTYAKQGGRGA